MKIIHTNIIISLIACSLFYSCTESESVNGPNGPSGVQVGQGGSLARMAASGDYLYFINDDSLDTFIISSDNGAISLVNTDPISIAAQTLFVYEDYIFIGGEVGMSIYDRTQPDNPQYISEYVHLRSCDPVVAQGHYAYVTLKGSGACGPAISSLKVIDISDVFNPVERREIPISAPEGLGIYSTNLFIANDRSELLHYFVDTNTHSNISLVNQINIPGIFDVIVASNHLLLLSQENIYQYSYEGSNLQYLSTLER